MPFRIKAKSRVESWEVLVPMPGPSLLDILQNEEIPIRSSCMGKGICHQCRIRVEKGVAPVSGMDRKAFRQELLNNGWRLSCGLRPRANLEVFFPQIYQFQDDLNIIRNAQSNWWVAVDLGTTGIELAAMDDEGEWARLKSLNRQIQMGPDVMTRLEYAQKRGARLLTKRAHQQLSQLLQVLIKADVSGFMFNREVYVAGNSAVSSFFADLDVSNLGVAPYQPASFESQSIKQKDWSAQTLPLIHSFVGGDVLAGLFTLWTQRKPLEQPWILVDVGTNSEILFWDGQRLFVSSTPAGPAFEGSSISIGMRAESGAIINPKFDEIKKSWSFDVIGADYPKGLCGSALVSFVAEALRAGLIKDDGEVVKEASMALTEELSITQADIREFQLAKSAIRTGLELVMKASPAAPKHLYMAGAFGQHMPLEACREIDLLPPLDVVILGNASLEGTKLWGASSLKQRKDFVTWLDKHKEPIELAMKEEFQEAFVRNMNLGES